MSIVTKIVIGILIFLFICVVGMVFVVLHAAEYDPAWDEPLEVRQDDDAG